MQANTHFLMNLVVNNKIDGNLADICLCNTADLMQIVANWVKISDINHLENSPNLVCKSMSVQLHNSVFR